jgi:hypothetical protein
VRRFLIFGLLDPGGSYLSLCLTAGWIVRWADLPLAYGIEMTPFLLCALIDRSLKDARTWERAVVAGIAGVVTSGIAVSVTAAVLSSAGAGFVVLGFYAAIPAAACSLLSTATDISEVALVAHSGDVRTPSASRWR